MAKEADAVTIDEDKIFFEVQPQLSIFDKGTRWVLRDCGIYDDHEDNVGTTINMLRVKVAARISGTLRNSTLGGRSRHAKYWKPKFLPDIVACLCFAHFPAPVPALDFYILSLSDYIHVSFLSDVFVSVCNMFHSHSPCVHQSRSFVRTCQHFIRVLQSVIRCHPMPSSICIPIFARHTIIETIPPIYDSRRRYKSASD